MNQTLNDDDLRPTGSAMSGAAAVPGDETRDLPTPAGLETPARGGTTSTAPTPRPRRGQEITTDDRPGGSSPDLRKLGRYTILGQLGEGGMGTVFDAFDHSLDRRVAVKVLRRSSEAWTRRLIREAQALAKLSHPNVVQVYEVGEIDGRAFVAMERIEGQTVTEWARRSPRPDWRACVGVFVQLGKGLAAAHAQGLVHRDFKPSNAIIDDEGRARVLDFGLARHADAVGTDSEPGDSAEELAGRESSALSVRMTRAGAIVGTPAYMSPEQSLGIEVDAASDQFNFCAALWEALYGKPPSEDTSLIEEHLSPIPLDPAVPRSLHRLLLRGLALHPAERWPSMEALLDELLRLVTPRSRTWGAAVGGVGLIALAGAWAYQSYVEHRREMALAAEQADRCTEARDRLVGVWDPPRRRQVQDAIEGTAVPHAEETWARVKSALDDYAGGWVETHTATCRATRVTQEQGEEEMSLRMGCLHERKVALEELVNVLVRTDAALVDDAATLAVSLPSLSRCDDIEALRAEQPPPEDPAIANAVQGLRAQLAEARALGQSGAYEEALDVSETVVDQAELLGYGPLRAESRLTRGRIHKRRGEYGEAEADLREAYTLGVEHGHPAIATEAASTLVFVVGYRQARHEAGLLWSHVALARARARGSEPENEALALANTATVHKHHGELDLALDAYQRALAIFEEHRGAEHLTVARSLGNIGGVFYMQGDADEALRYLERAWPILETSLGPRHPELAIWLSNLGSVLSERGRHQEALEHLSRALAIQEQAASPTISMAITLYNIGDAWENQGQHADAVAYYRRALVIFEQLRGEHHSDLALPLGSVARLLLEQGELDAAQGHFERALSIQTRTWGPDDARVADSLVGLAKIALERDDPEESRKHAKRAISLLEADGSAPVTLAAARFVLARASWSDPSRRANARALAEQARDAFAEAGPGYEDQRAFVRRWLAERER